MKLRTIIGGMIITSLAITSQAQVDYFDNPISYQIEGKPWAVFSADFDGDGSFAPAVNYSSQYMPSSVSAADLNGDATFEDPVQYLAGDAPTSLVSADLDGDTYDDLAVGNRNSNDILVYMNCGMASGVGDNPQSNMLVRFKLSQNVPNPFNPATIIEYSLQKRSRVSLTIHNVLGQLVAKLVNKNQSAGVHQVIWDGTGTSGKPVAGGMYFYQLCADDKRVSRKMVFLK